MTLTVRLKASQERLLSRAARRTNRTQSELVREAITRYAQACLEDSEKTAEERIARWIGAHDSGGLNLSEKTGRKFLAMLEKAHGKTRSR